MITYTVLQKTGKVVTFGSKLNWKTKFKREKHSNSNKRKNIKNKKRYVKNNKCEIKSRLLR